MAEQRNLRFQTLQVTTNIGYAMKNTWRKERLWFKAKLETNKFYNKSTTTLSFPFFFWALPRWLRGAPPSLSPALALKKQMRDVKVAMSTIFHSPVVLRCSVEFVFYFWWNSSTVNNTTLTAVMHVLLWKDLRNYTLCIMQGMTECTWYEQQSPNPSTKKNKDHRVVCIERINSTKTTISQTWQVFYITFNWLCSVGSVLSQHPARGYVLLVKLHLWSIQLKDICINWALREV